MARGETYRSAGVDIEAGDALVGRIRALARRTKHPEVLSSIGGFGAAFQAPKGMRSPVFVATTDGVGTKLRFAFDLGRHDTVGIDLVAMNVNDVLTLGARPLVFLDYFATGKLDVDQATDVVRGIAAGCHDAGCALVGGETAEMPSFYRKGEYDLAGFVVAVVEKRRQIDGHQVRPGHLLIGLPSSGLHSNGYSLVRRVIRKRRIRLDARIPDLAESLGEALIRPTRIYVRPVLSVLDRERIDAIAHITGGGIPGNLSRILPRGTAARLVGRSWEPPPIFDWLARNGPIARAEMANVFNLGLGMILAVAPTAADRVVRALRRRRIAARIVGEVTRGSGTVEILDG